jgi:hypothetical protein
MVRGSQLATLCCLCLLLITAPLRAEEDIDVEEPIPSSVDGITGPMARMGEEKPVQPGFSSRLKDQLQGTPPFIRDTKVTLNLRTFYLRRSNYDASLSEAWALGGALSYRSGWLYDRVSVGATLYTSQPLYGLHDRDGSGLLASGQNGYTVLGQLYGRLKLWDRTVLNLYRYGEYTTPYLSRDDSRMTPYTFEGYALQGVLGGKDAAPCFSYGGGYFTRIKDKTAEDFIWMSEKLGATAKRGVAVLGGVYTNGKFSVGAIDYFSHDIINIGYAETSYTMDLENGLGIRLAVQYSDQRSVGSDLLTGYSFATHQIGVKNDLSYEGAVLTLAFTTNSRGYDLQYPWSGYPGFTGAMITKYNKAGYSAWYTKLSYDFSRIGLDGVAAYALVAHGWDMVDQTTKEALPGENEFNADLQWRPTGNLLKGIWFRLRYGVAHQYEGDKKYIHDGRVIVNYDFPLL